MYSKSLMFKDYHNTVNRIRSTYYGIKQNQKSGLNCEGCCQTPAVCLGIHPLLWLLGIAEMKQKIQIYHFLIQMCLSLICIFIFKAFSLMVSTCIFDLDLCYHFLLYIYMYIIGHANINIEMIIPTHHKVWVVGLYL